MSRWRERLKVFILLPAVVAAVGVLAYFTFRTTLQVDTLRQQSVLEATLGLATEKANRLDRQIVDQDNVVVAIADPARLEELAERWLPTARRETPSVRAIIVLDESRTVLAFASRATSAFADEEAFRRLLTERIVGDMDLATPPLDQLRHRHATYIGQSWLLSYWQRVHAGRRYLVVAWHDIGRIVRETMPTLASDPPSAAHEPVPVAHTSAASRVNVVDEEGRIIFGPPLRTSEFTVGVRFPTTLYNWRVQVSPQASEEIASRVENRRLLEITMVSLSAIVIVVGAIAIVLVSEKERRISALKSEFVANVSHELKTPLALVRMFAEMLQSGRVASDAKRQEYLDIIVRESERLTALIENVLDFAKLERGRGSYELAEGDVGDAVMRAANVYRYRAEQGGVNLVVDVEPGLPRAEIDERAIQLAVTNLVDNALKYAPGGEEIKVRVRTEDDAVRVDVIDRGPGVPAEDRQRIFDRFVRLGQRAQKAGEAPVRGSGIGLALVKHIAESHGGRAWVESGGERGSVFSFSIPMSPSRRENARAHGLTGFGEKIS
ncbi:MAG: HAMP domain-containing histidine kinase [Labilithrix sp.]|nr:HAMP domain-containing histidine kinase [Labilithrix sp.]MCW5818073.1 HAMP domain-containing histidine kinase [Labilithrix sp.]